MLDRLLDEVNSDEIPPIAEAAIRRIMEQAIRFGQERPTKTKNPVPVLRLEVEFEDRDYLTQLANQAKEHKLITGFTIDSREGHYDWQGNPVKRNIFVLRTTIPRGAHSTAQVAYQHFYAGIREKWEVPAVYVNRAWAVNPDFSRWLELNPAVRKIVQTRDEDKNEAGGIRWTYTFQTPYINLWSNKFDFADDYHERGEEGRRHVATLVVTRSRKIARSYGVRIPESLLPPEGLIVPDESTLLAYLPRFGRGDLYNAISNGEGLVERDREMLERGKKKITIQIFGTDF